MNHVVTNVKQALVALLKSEKEIDDDFSSMMLSFIKEKEDDTLPFAELCILHYEAFAGDFDEEIFKVAAAIELLVLCFDMIDDIQDGDSSHSWATYPALGINSALAMLIVSTKIIRESSFTHSNLAGRIMEKHALQSIDGQQRDLLNLAVDESSYLQMIERKSGSLTAMSCLIGAALATGKSIAPVERYGRCIGVIHQLKNDISDLKCWGKKNDILNRKFTLPVIFLLALENEISRQIRQFYEKENSISLDRDKVQHALTESGSIRYALFFIHDYQRKAEQTMNRVPLTYELKTKLLSIMK
ncbi:transcriptional regulator [Bacillus sp. RO2]|uniref:polyprenyl synthetase family protein n=1 Tax=Bacillus sp. RO2 TaxID=2723913 RepID=UPI00145E8157|nr:polyprenyl synthetase family protein [Bacillus sp. RO2]NMH72011.1 transcriptional regulator [Bacillus sp. RO2]